MIIYRDNAKSGLARKCEKHITGINYIFIDKLTKQNNGEINMAPDKGGDPRRKV